MMPVVRSRTTKSTRKQPTRETVADRPLRESGRRAPEAQGRRQARRSWPPGTARGREGKERRGTYGIRASIPSRNPAECSVILAQPRRQLVKAHEVVGLQPFLTRREAGEFHRPGCQLQALKHGG